MSRSLIFSFLLVAAALGADGARAASPPSASQVREGLERLSWARRERRELSHERFSVAFDHARRFGAFSPSAARTLVAEVTGFGAVRNRLDSLGIELLFWTRPASADFDEDLAAVDALLDALGLPDEAGEGVLAHLRERLREISEPSGRLPARPAAATTAGLLVHSRASFSRGPGGMGGHALIQFTRGSAPESQWPTVQDVQRLQPRSRFPSYEVGVDVPTVSELSVADLSCRRLDPAQYQCRYRLTADDWLGPVRPDRRYSDRFRRAASGEWTLVPTE